MPKFIKGFIILILLYSSPCLAQTTNFNFDSGLGLDWQTYNSSGLFTISTSSQDIRISKDEDDLSVNSDEFIFGTVKSEFCLTGDFTVTVDFEIFNLPALPSNPLNECALSISGHNSSEAFHVLRFTHLTNQWLEAFSSTTGQIGQHLNPLNSGRFRISQTGNTITGFYAALGSSTFIELGSMTIGTEPKRISMAAVQGYNVLGNRGSNALDMRFDNLVVEGGIDYNCAAVLTEPSSWSSLKASFE